MTHPGNISNHFDAMHNCLSGQAGATADAPYLGSVLAKVRPSRRSVASYVWLIKCVGDPVFCAPNIGTGGSLGPPYAPLFVGSAENNPARPGFKAARCTVLDGDARAPVGTPPASGGPGSGPRSGTAGMAGLAPPRFRVGHGDGPRKAFDVEREEPRLRDRYGRNPLGQNLLLAPRLVESGVGFVTVNGWTGPSPGQKGGGPPSSSWDMHGGEMGMGNAFGTGSYGMGWCLPVLDAAMSALLTDLQERGLLESTLVVVVGEFGRTPRINQNKGASPGHSIGQRAIRPSWPAAAFAAAWSTASPTRSAPP